MKLVELFEARELPPPMKITEQEFKSLPNVDAHNVGDRFKVGKVAFDNRDGFGAVPFNADVDYFGFAAELRPSEFLKLASPADRSDDIKKFVGFIGERAPMGSPTFYINVNESAFEKGEPLRVKISEHEGRGRIGAVKQVNGDEYVPVHLILNGGMRAKNLSKEFFEALRDRGFISQDEPKDAEPSEVDIGRIFWMGKVL
jgi:hypothetical protein